MFAGLLALIGGLPWISGALSALPIVGRVFKFFKSPLGRFAGVVLLLVMAYGIGWIKGDAHGDAQAAAQARAAQAEAKVIDFDNLTARYKLATAIIARLQQQNTDAAAQVSALTIDLAQRPLQSTKPGAKYDPQALLDDRCNYTPLGRRRVRE